MWTLEDRLQNGLHRGVQNMQSLFVPWRRVCQFCKLSNCACTIDRVVSTDGRRVPKDTQTHCHDSTLHSGWSCDKRYPPVHKHPLQTLVRLSPELFNQPSLTLFSIAYIRHLGKCLLSCEWYICFLLLFPVPFVTSEYNIESVHAMPTDWSWWPLLYTRSPFSVVLRLLQRVAISPDIALDRASCGQVHAVPRSWWSHWLVVVQAHRGFMNEQVECTSCWMSGQRRVSNVRACMSTEHVAPSIMERAWLTSKTNASCMLILAGILIIVIMIVVFAGWARTSAVCRSLACEIAHIPVESDAKSAGLIDRPIDHHTIYFIIYNPSIQSTSSQSTYSISQFTLSVFSV